jgi:hypothetical protein
MLFVGDEVGTPKNKTGKHNNRPDTGYLLHNRENVSQKPLTPSVLL